MNTARLRGLDVRSISVGCFSYRGLDSGGSQAPRPSLVCIPPHRPYARQSLWRPGTNEQRGVAVPAAPRFVVLSAGCFHLPGRSPGGFLLPGIRARPGANGQYATATRGADSPIQRHLREVAARLARGLCNAVARLLRGCWRFVVNPPTSASSLQGALDNPVWPGAGYLDERLWRGCCKSLPPISNKEDVPTASNPISRIINHTPFC